MLLTLSKSVARRIPFGTILGLASVGSFVLLLLNDRIPPLVVSFVELYLSF